MSEEFRRWLKAPVSSHCDYESYFYDDVSNALLIKYKDKTLVAYNNVSAFELPVVSEEQLCRLIGQSTDYHILN